MCVLQANDRRKKHMQDIKSSEKYLKGLCIQYSTPLAAIYE